jgi:hypothetical protein
MTPGAKFSATTSHSATKRRNSALPASVLRFSEIDFLQPFNIANGTSAPDRASRRRRYSPPGGSTLMTSAPAIAIRKVA